MLRASGGESEVAMRPFNDFDETDETPDLKQRLISAVETAAFEAIAQLRLAAQGKFRFQTDQEFRACCTLVRMARMLLLDLPAPEPEINLAHPDVPPDEQLRLLELLERGHAEESGPTAVACAVGQ
jgi:hypothetical protein